MSNMHYKYCMTNYLISFPFPLKKKVQFSLLQINCLPFLGVISSSKEDYQHVCFFSIFVCKPTLMRKWTSCISYIFKHTHACMLRDWTMHVYSYVFEPYLSINLMRYVLENQLIIVKHHQKKLQLQLIIGDLEPIINCYHLHQY